MDIFGFYHTRKDEWGHDIVFENKTKPQHHVYSDRLVQWDYKKYNELSKKHFGNEGQYWDNRGIKAIENFLSEYFDKPVKLQRILKGENRSNGYPFWVFGYDEVGYQP